MSHHHHPQLTAQEREEVFLRLRDIFSDLAYFDQLIADKLRKFIADSNQIVIDLKTTRKVVERYFDTNEYSTAAEKAILAELQVVFRTASTLIISQYPENRREFYADVNQLLRDYPQFENQPPDELQYLLNFRNYMRMAVKIITPRLSKQLLLKVAARLEGSRRQYITGGGQKQCVTRRVQIYEKEGETHAEKRPKDRQRVPKEKEESAAGKRRNQSQALLRETKLRRLPSDEVHRLSRGPHEPVSVLPTQPTPSLNNNIAALYPPRPAQPSSSSLPPLPGPPLLQTMPSDLSLGLGEQVDLSDLFDFASAGPTSTGGAQTDMPPPPPPPLPLGNAPFNNGSLNGNFSNGAWNSGMTSPAFSSFSWNGNGNAFNNNNNNGVGSMGPPLAPQLSDTFPPTLSRTTSEVLNRLLPGGEVWNMMEKESSAPSLPPPSSGPQTTFSTSENNANLNPIQLLRSVSWDIYNGTLSEDLRSILGTF